MSAMHVDVVIVGAGLSGIGAAVHLKKAVPHKTYAILEARETSGGTWDLFRYPGIRSDSDMYTLGYSFRPWPGAKAIADGPSILDYIRDTAREEGVEKHIQYDSRVVRAEWSSEDAQWTLTVQHSASTSQVTCNFLFMCSGYYRYDEGYTPEFPGIGEFKGQVVHPQHWPEDLDYAGKNVVVIGSGATAVTLVPAMAETAEHVTMLQRTPTYIASRPAVDKLADFLRTRLPAKLAYTIMRWKNVLLTMLSYQLSVRRPALMKALVRKGIEKELPGFDLGTHFTPPYNPWTQRFCIVPDGDLFRAMRHGKASIATGHIETVTDKGIRLTSGEELPADIIVTATGLQMLVLGGVQLVVDGQDQKMSETVAYKGVMFSGIPNMAASFGYTNASWTLKCDLTCAYVGGLLAHMDRIGVDQAVARWTAPELPDTPYLNLQSGYILRSMHEFPRQGTELPWRVHQNYILDRKMFRPGPAAFEGLEFTRAPAKSTAAAG
jgi:cation diffusion facilitator CzcD-associated flavoprotein CzcO